MTKSVITSLAKVPPLVCLVLPACVDATVATPPPIDEMSCQTQGFAVSRIAGYDLDVVVAISDAPSMSAYRDAVAVGLEELGDIWDGSNIDLRVAVLAADGFVPVTDEQDPWFACPGDFDACRHRSYDGTLAEALIAATDLPEGAESTPLLQRLDDAFETDDGFFRPEAARLVFIISADDDASNWDPSDYAIRLRRRAARQLLVKVVAGADTPRLHEFDSWFPWGRHRARRARTAARLRRQRRG